MPEGDGALRRVFLSHSWQDKALARRIARRLSHRGVAVWIDEGGMQVGDRLSQKLEAEIRRSSHLVALLTKASVKSKWVTEEIKVARSSEDIAIIPVLAEKDAESDLLDHSLGLSIADPWTFEDRLNTLAQAILGHPVSDSRDFDLLNRDLKAIEKEEPELRELIGQLSLGRITQAQLAAATLQEELRHPAETALIALHECADADARYVISLVAAKYFRQLGVGYEVLRRQIAIEGKTPQHLTTMFFHLGDHITRVADIDGARILFDLVSPRMDQAFTRFIEANFSQLNQTQRDWAVKFVTVPERGPRGFSADAAFALFSRLPDSKALHAMWWFWINDYKFGGSGSRAEDNSPSTAFFVFMNEATRDGLKQFDPIMEHFEDCFRALARSRKLEKVLGAIDLLRAASDTRYVRCHALARQLADAVYTAEWNEFEHGRALAKPISDFADAIASDKSYADSLSAITDALPHAS